jgi:formylglycine-generating enzyme required for sulfatase activity
MKRPVIFVISLLLLEVAGITSAYGQKPKTQFVPQGEMLEEMVFVTGGVFEMGCKADRDDKTSPCNTWEKLHWVKVNNFYIGKYEVTQGLWKKVMGSLPSSISGNFLGDDKPVIYVNWYDIAGSGGFLEKLNAQTGKNYRLPTEAEWEYAARGCTGGVCESYEFSGGNTIDDVAWYTSNSSGYAHTIGTKRANGLGLYDMNGNVCEWCSDWFSDYCGSTIAELGNTTQSSPIVNPTGPGSGSFRVLRGGSWSSTASHSRVADRDYDMPVYRTIYFGFRLVLP